MLIVKLETEECGARANQVVFPALDSLPEGWVAIPEKLEARALELLPWMTLKLRRGVVTGVGDDDIARAAAKLAAVDGAEAEEGSLAGVGAGAGVSTGENTENN